MKQLIKLEKKINKIKKSLNNIEKMNISKSLKVFLFINKLKEYKINIRGVDCNNIYYISKKLTTLQEFNNMAGYFLKGKIKFI